MDFSWEKFYEVSLCPVKLYYWIYPEMVQQGEMVSYSPCHICGAQHNSTNQNPYSIYPKIFKYLKLMHLKLNALKVKWNRFSTLLFWQILQKNLGGLVQIYSSLTFGGTSLEHEVWEEPVPSLWPDPVPFSFLPQLHPTSQRPSYTHTCRNPSSRTEAHSQCTPCHQPLLGHTWWQGLYTREPVSSCEDRLLGRGLLKWALWCDTKPHSMKDLLPHPTRSLQVDRSLFIISPIKDCSAVSPKVMLIPVTSHIQWLTDMRLHRPAQPGPILGPKLPVS